MLRELALVFHDHPHRGLPRVSTRPVPHLSPHVLCSELAGEPDDLLPRRRLSSVLIANDFQKCLVVSEQRVANPVLDHLLVDELLVNGVRDALELRHDERDVVAIVVCRRIFTS